MCSQSEAFLETLSMMIWNVQSGGSLETRRRYIPMTGDRSCTFRHSLQPFCLYVNARGKESAGRAQRADIYEWTTVIIRRAESGSRLARTTERTGGFCVTRRERKRSPYVLVYVVVR